MSELTNRTLIQTRHVKLNDLKMTWEYHILCFYEYKFTLNLL